MIRYIYFTIYIVLACCTLQISCTNLPPTCKPANIYGDHMVLQREPHGAVLWGYTDPGLSVNVTLQEVNYTSKGVPGPFGDTIGVWRVVFPPQPAGGPYIINITCYDGMGNQSTSQLQDVVFGDIWVCSGQSNMAFAVKQAMNATAELAASVNYPDIRVLSVQQEESETPFYDVQSLYHPWARASPESLGANEQTSFLFFSAVCWFYGRDLYNQYKVPLGLISNNWGGTPVEAWSSPEVINTCIPVRSSRKFKNDTKLRYSSESANEKLKKPRRDERFGGPHGHSVLWNAMMHPFLNMSIKGAIWYQGEANTPDPETYRCLFQAMITDWRMKWYEGSMQQTDPYFPIGFVQLCTSGTPEIGYIGNYPITRWHQTDDVGYVPSAGMPNVFMAVALDLPDLDSPWDPIHPRFKQDVGSRLAHAARAVAYKEKGLHYLGPFPIKFTVDSKALMIDITYNSDGSGSLRLLGPLTNTFEVCCSKSKTCQATDLWIGTTVVGVSGGYTLKLSYNCLGYSPVAVRYNWRGYACTYKKCTVYDNNGFLPGPPFWLPI